MAAIAGEDVVRILAAVRGHDIDDALQHVGAAITMALERRRRDAEPVALSVINRLTERAGPDHDYGRGGRVRICSRVVQPG